MDDNYSVKSLTRAMRILECFSVDAPELGVSDIAKMLNMQKSTVSNILNTFKLNGYIMQNPRTSKYYIGLKMLHFSYIVNHHLGLRDLFVPYMRRIADACHEICYFGILDNLEVLYIEAAAASSQQQARSILGERAPLYCTGLGKAMLANLPDDCFERVISKGMRAFTPNTLSDAAALRRDLDFVKQNGYSIDNMEHEYGICCVAVPIFAADGRVIAAVSVSGPSPRFDKQTIENNARLIREVIKPLQYCL